MAQIQYIRYLRDVEGLSIAEIARRTGTDWRTARKYADGERWPDEHASGRKRARPVMDAYAETVDTWLLEDQCLPRKQRRTAAAIYEGLQKEDFGGSERTVREYVRQRKQELAVGGQERFVGLEHDPGEAQVDFGDVYLFVHPDGKLVLRALLVMSFPYSNVRAARLLPAQNLECTLQGMKDLFHEIGGVPREIWFDNMSTIVKKVRKGNDRELTEAFERFKWHYHFEARYCNVGRGNEKGNVENGVGYVRRRFLSPPPVFTSWQEVNDNLAKKCRDARQEIHYRKKKQVHDLFREDEKAFRRLPTNDQEIYRVRSAVSNSTSEVVVDGERYYVPVAQKGQRVTLKMYWDRVEVYDRYGEKRLGESPRAYSRHVQCVDWAAAFEVLLHKPRAIPRATFVRALPHALKAMLLNVDGEVRLERLRTLTKLLRAGHELQELEEAVRKGLEYGRVDDQALTAILAGNALRAKADLATPEALRQWRPDLMRYDLLMPEVKHRGG